MFHVEHRGEDIMMDVDKLEVAFEQAKLLIIWMKYLLVVLYFEEMSLLPVDTMKKRKK